MYGEAGIKYSYAAHLPDTGTVSLLSLKLIVFYVLAYYKYVYVVRLRAPIRVDTSRRRADRHND